MGFLENLFGSKDRIIEIHYSELEGWVDLEKGKLSNQAVKDARQPVSEVLEGCKRLREIVLDIEKMPYEDLPTKLKSIVKTSKPEYVSSMLSVLDVIIFPQKADYSALLKFQTLLSESLEKIAKITFSHGRYLPFAYGDSLTKVQREVKGMIDAGKNLDEKVASYNRIPLLDKIRNVKQEVEDLNENKKSALSQIAALKKELNVFNSSLSNSEKDLLKLSEDPNESLLKDEIEKTLLKVDELKSIINNSFGSLNRPLRKYQRIAVSEGNLSNEDLKTLEGFIQNPVDEFLSGANVESILHGMEKAVIDGKIEIKNPEKISKTVEECLSTLNPSLSESYRLLLEKERKLKEELFDSPAGKQSKKLESSIAQLKSSISLKSDELKVLEKKASDLEKSMEESRKQIQTALSEFDATLIFD